MNRPLFALSLAVLALAIPAAAAPRLEDTFAHPPADTRPWVFWFWANGNVTREGITRDLEAMKRVGVGGVAWMEVDQDVPPGPVRFLTPEWQDLLAFAVSEAGRLGLKFDLNNDNGWTGSGGPWIDGEHSMQKVVWTEQHVTGPSTFEGTLAQPATEAGFYRDIAVLAYPTPEHERKIDKAGSKSGLGLIASPERPAATAGIPRNAIVDLMASVHDGKLSWQVPAGKWTLFRVGHTSTGKTNYPAVPEGRGLDVDKLDRTAFDRHYDAFVGQMLKRVGARPGANPASAAALTTVHIDSWEVGYQNWTAAFQREFTTRRGYDPVPWLPAFAGHVVGDAAQSERFLWDVRRTISELLDDNYAARMAERAHADGRTFTLEAYRNGPFDCLSYGGRADIPTGEFWMSRDPATLHPSVKTMASVGHIYGRRVVAAEAFTATDSLGKQRNHPYSMKAIGDAAFCAGINHFIFHRYAMQPWDDSRKPGMTMGPWGVEYERTATWWEETKPWHEYVSRCEAMLQQGTFVADFCYLQSEEGINNPALPSELKPVLPEGYDFDFCSDEVVRTRMAVKDGRLVLPDGMSYRMLILPPQRLMRPELLRKIRDLVRAGAVVFGQPPLHSPSLSGYPGCDDEVAALSRELWGDNPGATVNRPVGRGRVLWAASLTDVLPQLGWAPDFAWRQTQSATAGKPGDAPMIRSLHRTLDDREVYFVANLSEQPASLVASFRTTGTPELWDAQSGEIHTATVYQSEAGRVRVNLDLDSRGSIFVVIKKAASNAPHLVSVSRNGAPAIETGSVTIAPQLPPRKTSPTIKDSFTMAAWVNPNADTTLPAEAVTGTSAYSVPRNDVLFPPPVHELLNDANTAGTGFAVGRNGITVLEHGDHFFAAPLVYAAPITTWTHVAVVFDHGTPTLYVNGEKVRTGRRSDAIVYAGVGVVHGREIDPYRGDHSVLRQVDHALSQSEVAALMKEMPRVAEVPLAPPAHVLPGLREVVVADDRHALVAAVGRYAFTFSDGHKVAVDAAALPEPLTVTGEWTLSFPSGWSAPASVTLPQLISWSEHTDPGVRYFSGTATYRKTLSIPADRLAAGRRLVLDLGDVSVIAEVRLNGRPVATLWKPPFQADVTGLARAGDNALEVAVTNLWVNRLIGDEQLPADREWTKVPKRGGWALKQYPDWFQRGERSPTGRVTFATWKHYDASAPLLPSGLLGPVVLRSEAEIAIVGENAEKLKR